MDARLVDMIASVAKVEAGVMSLHAKVDALTKVSTMRLNDHAKRVDSLERTRDKVKGAARLTAVLGGASSAVIAYFRFWG
jgi:hypothetical protein